MAKKGVSTEITKAKDLLKALMEENLVSIAAGVIDQIISFRRNNPDHLRFDATKGLRFSGLVGYRADLLQVLAIIAYSAIQMARREVPAKRNIRLFDNEESFKLGEWEMLPSDLRQRLQSTMDRLANAQAADLEKSLVFQYGHSVDSTQDLAMLKKDLAEAADEYIAGASINSGAGVIASQVVNEARSAFFFDDEVLEELDAFEFVNGDPITDVCQELAGTIFAKDDPDLTRYTPPLHWGCKSYIIPILKGNLKNREISKVALTKGAQKQIQFSECGHTWTE